MEEAVNLLVEAVAGVGVGETRVYLPCGCGDLVEAVMAYMAERYDEMPHNFSEYTLAMKAIWPAIYIASGKAALMVTCEVYLEIASVVGFTIDIDDLRGLELDPNRIHRDSGGNDGTSVGPPAGTLRCVK